MSLLQNKILPLWVWIVIIVVGSLAVIGTVVFSIRILVLRKRDQDFIDTFGNDDVPKRKLTLRRGRAVTESTTSYFSLTGSRFGVNAFNADEKEDETTSRKEVRSRSPFEWWNTFKKRSSVRDSQISQTPSEISSSWTGPRSPARVYRNPEWRHSTASLVPDADPNEPVTASMTETTRPEERKPINFSRSLSAQGRYPRQHRSPVLSRIEESSPHTSMIGTKQASRVASITSQYTTHDLRSSLRSNNSDLQPRISSQVHTPSSLQRVFTPMDSDLEAPKPIYKRHDSDISSHSSRSGGTRHNSSSSLIPRPRSQSRPQSQSESSTYTIINMSPLPNVGYGGSRSSYGNSSTNDTSKHASTGSLHCFNQAQSQPHSQARQRPRSVTASPDLPPSPKVDDDEIKDIREDGHPRRSSSRGRESGRGNVLRKKSLKRADLVGRVDS